MRLIIPSAVNYIIHIAYHKSRDLLPLELDMCNEYSGWTLVNMSAKGSTPVECTITVQPNQGLHVISKNADKTEARHYVLVDGTVLADLGSYGASMLAHRESAHQKTVLLEVMLWTVAFSCFKHYAPEKMTLFEARRINEKIVRKSATATINDYILKLTPEKIQYVQQKRKEREEEHEKRTNRYHMARGHYRHYKSGKVVWVKEHYKGDKSKGIINKDYMLTAIA